jgi:protein SCO1/2
MKTALATAAALLLALFATAGLTDGFRAYTSEQARRRQVIETRPWLPDTLLLDQHGTRHRLRDWVVQERRLLIVEFVYTRCDSVCRALGSEFQQLQRSIMAKGLQQRVALLSISFDPQHDTPAVLARHAAGLQADPAIWRFASVDRAADLPALLQFFGITVIADGLGGYQHNAALLGISPEGRLMDIADYASTSPRALLDAWLQAPLASGT